MNCWDYKKCGREVGGIKTQEHGVCPAYPDAGKNCWQVAGTFCGGIVQGTEAQKKKSCLTCDWYLMVNPLTGTEQEI